MFKKYLTLVLIFSVINLFFINAAFAQTENTEDVLSRNIKNTVAQVATEPNRKLNVKLKDGTKFKGFITEIKNDHFSLLDSKTSKVTEIQYSNVIEAKRDGVKLPFIAKVAIGTAIAFGVLIGLSAIAVAAGGVD